MNTQFAQEHPHVTENHEKKMAEVAGTGATTEAIGAAAGIVVAIVGLAGALPLTMMAISTIVIGAALLLDAGAVGARWSRLVGRAALGEEHVVREEVGGGMSAEALGGLAGIVLGILALLGTSPSTLCAAALIVFGAALLFGSALKGRLVALGATQYEATNIGTGRAIAEALSLSSGGDVLVGIGAVVLGILALLSVAPITLVLVGYIGVSAVVLLSGTALGARMVGVMHHHVH